MESFSEVMEFTWKEYQKAKHIVEVFEKEKRVIHDKRMLSRSAFSSFDLMTPKSHKERLNILIWYKRSEINKEMYSVRRLIELNDFNNVSLINSIIDNRKLELLSLRKQWFLK